MLSVKYLNIHVDPEGAELATFRPIIKTDRQRVMQVLLGLQSNALKFTHDGKVDIIVKIIPDDDGKYLEITVADTGIGISE